MGRRFFFTNNPGVGPGEPDGGGGELSYITNIVLDKIDMSQFLMVVIAENSRYVIVIICFL